MKLILTHILFFFTVMLYAQTTPEESAKLKRERVKSRTTLSENYDINVVNEYQSWRKEEFDAEGNLIVADILYFVRGLEQLLNRKEYFEYDSLGNVTLIRRVYSTYEESDQYTYTYDEKGNILKKQHDHFEDDRKTYTRFYEYAYNDEGLLMHRYYRGAKMELYTITTFEYDSLHRKIKEITCDRKRCKVPLDVKTYVYDDHGNCVEDKTIDKDGDVTIYTAEYDAHGNVLKWISANGVLNRVYNTQNLETELFFTNQAGLIERRVHTKYEYFE